MESSLPLVIPLLDIRIFMLFDKSEGFKEFTVIYFPSSKPITRDDLQGKNTFAVAAGGEHGFMTSNPANEVNGLIEDGLTLYTISNVDGESYSEVSGSRGGQIVPVNFVDAMIGGQKFDCFIGGKDGDKILAWTTRSSLAINAISGNNYLTSKGVQTLTFDAIASDDSNGKATVVLFEFRADGTVVSSTTTTVDTTAVRSGVQVLCSTLRVGLVMLSLTSSLW